MTLKLFEITYFFLGVLILMFPSCTQKLVDKSVYHWETEFDLSSDEENFLESEGIKKVYAKFFDITLSKDNKAMPVAKIDFISNPKQEIIPVVYIVTDVFKELDSTAVKILAVNTYDQLQQLHPKNESTEIQIDCDWMPSIKDKYFYFLTELKSLMGENELSSTIRLYQYKYPGLAGVPPVDKGVLMYYNMGEILSYAETNSILNNDIGKQYLGFGEYPIPLDFALPNFSWSLLYRFGEFEQIIPRIDESVLVDTSIFMLQANQYFLVKRDTFFHNVYLRFGDELRYEKCLEDELIRAAKLLSPEKNQNKTTLLFYDLKPHLVNESDKINRVFTAFK